MKRKTSTIWIAFFLIMGNLLGIINFQSEDARAPSTFVSGIQYDGMGGPWNLSGSPYIVIGDVTIPEGQTLTIEAGVQVEFSDYYSLNVNGSLVAIGTEVNRINITSGMVMPVPGDWRGILIPSTGNVEIVYCNISYSDLGIYLMSSSGNRISHNSIFSNEEFGIILSYSNNNTILNNTISSHTYGLYLVRSLNNTIENNSYIDDGILIEGDLIQHFNTHFIPTSNTVNGRSLYYIKDSNNFTIDGLLAGQLILVNCSEVGLKNLNINTTDVGIEIAYSTDINVTDSVLSLNEWGILLEFALNINIINNTIAQNNGPGIMLWKSHNNTILNNINSNNYFGMMLYSSINNSILNNYISSNDYEGITLYISPNNTISHNDVTDNYYGLRPIDSSNNVMSYNNISLNDWGIFIDVWFDVSSNNRIFHNNIIGNINQAVDYMHDNFWNDSYPSGGNYWSDWISPDILKGENQDIPGSDGIVDNLYIIDSNSADYFPLVTPYNPGPSPLPPTNFNAQLDGYNCQNVTLKWNLSGDDGSGENDVFGYAIYYNINYSTNREGYDFLDFVSNGTNSYIHFNAGESDLNNYYYYVKAWALDRIGNSSENQTTKFTRTLQAGKHLISIPALQLNEDIDIVLQTLTFDVAWFYNNSDLLDPWKSYNPSKPLNVLTTVNHTMALWINVTENSNLTVAGIIPKFTNIELKAGWNFVGYPSFIEKIVSNALNGVNYERIEGYYPILPENLRIYSDSDSMVSGYGYWIKVSTDVMWTLQN